MNQPDADRLLVNLYGAPLRPELWDTFLGQLTAMLGVSKAALIAHNLPKGEHKMLAVVGDSVKASIKPYESHYGQYDEWAQRFVNHKATLRENVLRGEAMWPRATFLRSTFYNEFLEPFDTCQMACIGALGVGGRFEALSIYRGPSENSFSDEALEILKSLVPHVQTALNLRRQLSTLEERISDLEASLHAISTAVVLIDAKSQCTFLNQAAQRLIDLNDGLMFDKRELCAQDVRESARLREILSAVSCASLTSRSARRGMCISRRERRPLNLVAAPLREGFTSGKTIASAIVLIRDPEEDTAIGPDLLISLFRLTAAEGRLSQALLNGNSLSEAANTFCVSEETVRTQLKSILQKTGTKRQSELIRLLMCVATPSVQRQ